MNKLWKIDETACCAGFEKNFLRLFRVVFLVVARVFLCIDIRNLSQLSFIFVERSAECQGIRVCLDAKQNFVGVPSPHSASFVTFAGSVILRAFALCVKLQSTEQYG